MNHSGSCIVALIREVSKSWNWVNADLVIGTCLSIVPICIGAGSKLSNELLGRDLCIAFQILYFDRLHVHRPEKLLLLRNAPQACSSAL